MQELTGGMVGALAGAVGVPLAVSIVVLIIMARTANNESGRATWPQIVVVCTGAAVIAMVLTSMVLSMFQDAPGAAPQREGKAKSRDRPGWHVDY